MASPHMANAYYRRLAAEYANVYLATLIYCWSMDNGVLFDYYINLLQVEMAILGVVIAGIVALMQILGSARPRRQTSLLIKPPVLFGYIAFISFLLIFVALGCWVSAFPMEATSFLGYTIVHLYANSAVLFGSMALSIASLFVFAYLTYKARKLMDSREYLMHYAQTVSPKTVREYLRAIYDDELQSFASKPSKKSVVSKRGKDPFASGPGVYDPFQPVREYIKDNAFNSYDYGTASGLKLFSQIFDKAFNAAAKKAQPDEYYRLAKYIGESCLEFFVIFEKTSSEKRKMDIIKMLYSKGERFLYASKDAEGLVTIVRALEGVAKVADDDDEVIAVVSAIHKLTDAYLERFPNAKWLDIAPTFEEICLSVTRISETYYLQKDNPLKTVPIIGHYTGEYRSVTAALVDFFCSYRDLADRYTDTYPQYYFEAIEAVIEALFARLADFVSNGQHQLGLNATYNRLANSLFSLYSAFGLDAIEHKKPELLALSMGNLRRIVKPAKNLGLSDERSVLTIMFVELAIKGIETLGDVPLKGERTISMYTKETMAKHGSAADIKAGLAKLEEEGTNLKAGAVAPTVMMLRALHR